MATVINNPTPNATYAAETNSGMGFMVGIILAIILGILLLVYGLPAITGRNDNSTAPSINSTIDSGQSGTDVR